jgi:hypothetical protein
MINWLPELVLLEDVDGVWTAYLERVYSIFSSDFIKNRVLYKNKVVSIRKYPITDGKEQAFWHLISDGGVEDERVVDIERCKRIRWPKPVIETTDLSDYWVWENQRGSEKRILLYIHEERYLVVLGVRNGYFLLCTAYFVEQNHRHIKLYNEYSAFCSNYS